MKRAVTNAKRPAKPQLDPVVELSKQLLRLWDADDGSQLEYSNAGETVDRSESDSTLKQFRDWRDAVEKIVSYTQATGIEGALVQLALALDTLRDILPGIPKEHRDEAKELQLDRLIMSAMRGVRNALSTEIDPTVGSIVEIYAGHPIWIDYVDEWAAKGHESRHGE